MNFKILIVTLFAIALFGIAAFSCYIEHQKKKLNYLVLEKINNVEQELSIIKKQITELKNKANKSSMENTISIKNYSNFNLEEKPWLNSIDFENEIKNFHN